METVRNQGRVLHKPHRKIGLLCQGRTSLGAAAALVAKGWELFQERPSRGRAFVWHQLKPGESVLGYRQM